MPDPLVRRTLMKRRLARTLREFCIDVPENQGLHSWRCRPPYNQPPCKCFEDMLEELTNTAMREV